MKGEQLPKHPVLFTVRCSRQYRLWACLALLSVTLATIFETGLHYMVKVLTDTAAAIPLEGERDFSALWFWGLAYPIAAFANQMLWRSSGFTAMQWITRISAGIYKDLFAYLTEHSTAYFQDRFAGSISNKISNVARGVEALLARFLWEFFPLILGSFAKLVLVYWAHPYFAYTYAVWLLFFLGINILFVRRLHIYSLHEEESTSELKGRIVDSTTNIESVHHAGHGSYEQEYVGDYVDTRWKAHIKSWWVHEWLLVTNSILVGLFSLSMFALAVYLLQSGSISVGTLVMIISLMIAIRRQLFFIGNAMTQAMGEYGQVKEGLREVLIPHEIEESQGAHALEVSSALVRFEHVSFAYDKQELFRNFSLTIRAGEKLGLVGPSGAGKSTLVSLVLRQFEIQEGKILIDEQDIRNVTKDSLRRNIALVPQSVSLFHRSIEENIRYGRLDASLDEVAEAAKLAQAYDFIEALPNGFQTYVGERGVKLSGGQRQRIAVARAILKNAPILVLDEATSALDSESEVAIQTALSHLMQDKTVIAIAHRLSTLRAMDCIVVIDEGSIVESGSHEELLALEGRYARLWKSQVSGFIQE